MKTRIVETAEQIGMPIAADLGYEIVDVQYKKEGKNWYLRFFIDKPEGVNVQDCERFSKAISQELDFKDPIPNSYILEVSSPGIDRPLSRDTDFERNLNKKVNVKLFEPIDGLKHFKARLLAYDSQKLVLEVEKKGSMTVPRGKIALIKPVIEL